MKKIYLTSLFLFVSGALFSQISIKENGNIGIGIDAPYYPLHINIPYLTIYSQGYGPMQIDSRNSTIQSGTNAITFTYFNQPNSYIPIYAQNFFQYSDERAKTNISELNNNTVSPLKKVLSLTGYSYDWKENENVEGLSSRKSNTSDRQVGFLAQQVEAVIPEAVATMEETGAKLVSYTQIIPYLVEAIKEQQITIDNLTKQLNAMQQIRKD